MALWRPGRLRRVVLVDIAPVSYSDGSVFAFYAAELQRLHAARVPSRRVADELLRETVPDSAVRQFLLTNLVADPADGALVVRNNVDALSRAIDEIKAFPVALPSGEALRPFDRPALIIYGSKGRYVRPVHHPIIRALFPSARTAFVGIDAGHWVHAEQPQRFMDELVRFVTEP
eukprot:Unigene13365_Nuclearia_a/m.40509 Unigene13365_Nuclearia_a/g.40509  ORF Unigene13365_Nuclearia_a/g.40509 Unigene13365_Nuclearia_a/m.40509 type:complete len:174 (+) Unigene13365_Nuclearia_a:409-930(+)